MRNNKIKKIIRKFFIEKDLVHNIKNVDINVASSVLLRTVLGLNKPVVIVLPSLNQAEACFAQLQEWKEFLELSVELKLLPGVGGLKNCIPENEASRAKILFELANNPVKTWYIGSSMSCFSPVPPKDLFLKKYIKLQKGEEFNFSDLKKNLVEMDYDNEFQVNSYGEFAVRGGIIDIYSPLAELPARVEFWGDEVDEIRLFPPSTQKSIKEVESYEIVGRTTIFEDNDDTSFIDYFSEKPLLVVVNPTQCEEHIRTFGEEINIDLLKNYLNHSDTYKVLDAVESASSDMGTDTNILSLPIDTAGMLNEEVDYSNKILCTQLRVQQIRQWLENSYSVVLVGNGTGACEHLENWCAENKIPKNQINMVNGRLTNGIIIPGEKIVLLTEKDLFFIKNKRHLPFVLNKNKENSEESVETANFADLNIGDYAVHLTHGIGIYNGITEITVSGNVREVMEIEYDGEVKLFVPIWQAAQVSRYIGSRKSLPKLNKIGSSKWDKMKLSALRAAQGMAADMLKIQAMRYTENGFQFIDDDQEQILFEEAFPYYETPDQLKAAIELKKDMVSPKPMDRLICGDVGYGKTEVAMRGAFKAVMAGKQVAVLVPTTILAQQHFFSFRERFAEYPVIIEMLSRFKTKGEQKKIICDLKEGKVDIIIGTHRLAQDDIEFASLGFIVIDEEQRFGVMHKEKLKKLKTTVDVLSMTATPIPRTLYLAMSGIRDLSTIMTAPTQRLPVQTSVCQFDEKIITQTIKQEIQRGGQVFFVHNRVKTIEARCKQLQELVPEANFGVGHGQMHEHQLEDVMTSFIEGTIDVLVCTTIIESGVDIPNANTIIIERADRFGLAELYQLRGRVGRWSRQAYAYLLLPLHNIMTGNARARLAAIRKYTQLGAGFRLALKDLEIRGAGNLLGASQSGHINAIGFELYCQLLKSSIAQLKGQGKKLFLPTVDLSFDFLDFGLHAAKGRLLAGLPQDYIPSEMLRVDFYRRFTGAVNLHDIEEIIDELKDRFGAIPKSTQNLISVMKIRLKVANAGYSLLTVSDGYVFIGKSGRRNYLINGKIPKLKNTQPQKMMNELDVLVSNLST